MIKSVTLKKDKESFTGKLYDHTKKDVTFHFTDGINIITGRNGSGKSVLLNVNHIPLQKEYFEKVKSLLI